MADLDTAVARLGELIAFPTVSSDGNLEMIVHLASMLSDAGARVELFHDPTGQKASLFATLGPEAPGGVLLSGHTDVVPADPADWSSDPFAMRAEGGRLYGRGACDMKGFIAAAMACLPGYASADLRRPLSFAFTYDEEVGCLGARQLVAELRQRELRPDLAIIGEPTSMRVVEGHKGCHEYTTRFTGAEGHGSAPDRGVNAVEYAARFIGRLLEIREDLRRRAPAGSRFDPPWSTLNVGRVAGGMAHNVIAGAAEVDWETRPVTPGDAAFVRAAAEAYCREVLLPAMRRVAPDADVETLVVGEVGGLEPMPENAARALVAALTGAEEADVVAFGTEAGLFQSLGMAAVVCGPGSIEQAHKPDEYVEIAQLDRCLGMLRDLGPRLAAAPA